MVEGQEEGGGTSKDEGSTDETKETFLAKEDDLARKEAEGTALNSESTEISSDGGGSSQNVPVKDTEEEEKAEDMEEKVEEVEEVTLPTPGPSGEVWRGARLEERKEEAKNYDEAAAEKPEASATEPETTTT